MSLYESEELPFDKRFARYNEPGGPGLAVMAIQDDATRFKNSPHQSKLEFYIYRTHYYYYYYSIPCKSFYATILVYML